MNDFLQKILGSDKADVILSYLPSTGNTNQYSFFSVLFMLISVLPIALLFVVVGFILYGAYKVNRSEGDPKKHEAGITTVKRAVYSFFFLFLIIILTNAFSLAILGKTTLEGMNAFQVCEGTINGVTGPHLILEYFRNKVEVPTNCVKSSNVSVFNINACVSCINTNVKICSDNARCYRTSCLRVCSLPNGIKPEERESQCSQISAYCGALDVITKDFCNKAYLIVCSDSG